MFEYPDDLKYTDSHEYIRVEGDIATIGITAFAIDRLGDIVFVDLPEPSTSLTKGETFGTVESVKAVEDIYAPLSGKVIETNTGLIDNPEQLSEDPYGVSWLVKVRVDDPDDAEEFMTAAEYCSKVEGI
jgi:glycine cleavage system H protein